MVIARKKVTARRLRELITFSARYNNENDSPPTDGYGNVEEGWVDQFTVHAEIIPLKGGGGGEVTASEEVLASRLAGVQPVVIIVRYSDQTKLIKTDWKATNARSGVIYNIRTTVNMDQKKQFLDILASTGVAV